MVHDVKLSAAPRDLQIPEELRERFWYDTRRQRLCFNGFMSKATFDRLERLSADPGYQESLESLFRISVPESLEAPRKGVRAWTTASLVGAVAVAGLAAWMLLA